MINLLNPLLRKVAVLLTLAVASTGFAASVGQPAPDFTLTDIDGNAVTLSSLKGKTVVLEWVNQECPFVVKHYDKSGNLPALQKQALADGVVWLQINSAAAGKQGDYSEAKVKDWQKEHGVVAAHYFRDSDGKVGNLYAAKTTPHMYVINAEGTLVYNGAIDSIRSANPKDIDKADNYVTAALAAVKAGTAVEKAVTVPYGCSVKY
ncbi:MAG: redoxin domain-containing protein [Verrucomicrobiota bacterium]